MNTRKEISTIGYQSKAFLVQKLQELIYSHTISDYMMVWHQAEEDEKKPHWHIWIQPNTQVDSMDIQEFLKEFNTEDPEKPFKCINFQYSQSDDWIPYCLHDRTYLAIKHEARKYHYGKEDIVCYDEDTFEFLYHQAFYSSKWSEENRVFDRIIEGMDNPAKLIESKVVSFKDAGNLRNYLWLKNYDHTIRGEHRNHEEE